MTKKERLIIPTYTLYIHTENDIIETSHQEKKKIKTKKAFKEYFKNKFQDSHVYVLFKGVLSPPGTGFKSPLHTLPRSCHITQDILKPVVRP